MITIKYQILLKYVCIFLFFSKVLRFKLSFFILKNINFPNRTQSIFNHTHILNKENTVKDIIRKIMNYKIHNI